MIDTTLALQGPTGAAVLVIISFLSLLTGVILRNWPERVRERLEDLDGTASFLTREAYCALTRWSGQALVFLSFAALLAAAFMV
jgi:hypothetical protein